MNDFLVLPVFFGCVAFFYWLINRSLKKRGCGKLVRYPLSSVGGAIFGFIVFTVIFTILPSSSTPEASSQIAGNVTVQEEVVEELAEESVVASNEAPLPTESEVIEESPLDRLSADRAEVENGPDLGVTPAQYADRFNSLMVEAGQPYRIDATIDPEDIHVQAVFNHMLSDQIGIIGMAKPESLLMHGFLMTGNTDGTVESGAKLMIVFSGAMAAIQPGLALADTFPIFTAMFKESGISDGQEDGTATTVYNGVQFSISKAPMFGMMLSAQPAD